MEAWIPGIAVAIQILAIGGILLGWRWARGRARAVESQARASGISSYSQLGGARLGSFNATIPFATLAATPSAITLSVLRRQYEFEKSCIQSLARHPGFLSTGLRVEHNHSNTPQLVVFWTTSFTKLASSLEQLGWQVRR